MPMVKKKSCTFGILTTPAKDIFHSNYHLALLRGITSRLKVHKVQLKVLMMPPKPFKSLDAILTQNGLDGLMILTWRWIHPSIARLIESTRSSRVLVVNDPVPGLKVNIFFTDTDAGMAQAVAHLVKKGHRKMGLLHGPWEVLFHRTQGTGSGKKKRPVPKKGFGSPSLIPG